MNKNVESFFANIWIAGSYADAVRACREFCARGACVTVTPTAYVYTGGAEDGVLVRLINYPRFPKSPAEIKELALALGEHLKAALFQGSYSIEFPDVTYWYTTRPQDG